MIISKDTKIGAGPVFCLLTCLQFLFVLFFSMPAAADEKITIGAVEEVLLPWGVTVPARIDTGAATSSIDVCDYTVRDGMIAFTLADRCGGHRLSLPLMGFREVRATEGQEKRPVVEIDICLGPKKIRTEVTLNDRSKLEFPFLAGRNFLQGNFVVDVGRSRTVSPACPARRENADEKK